MKSIFDLKTKNSQLSSANQGLSNYKFQEVNSLRTVTGDNFPDGEIVFRWTYGSSKYWIPNKSYVKIKMKLTNPSGSRLSQSKNICWAMNTVPGLFQSSSYKIADQTVCSITQNLPQIDSLKNRMNKSDGWLQSVGQSNNNWTHSFKKREQNMFSAGGNDNAGGLNCFATWDQIRANVSTLGIAVGDSIAIAEDAASGTYLLTLTDSAGRGHIWSKSGVTVGDVICYETILPVLGGTDERVLSSGVITELTDLTIRFIPHNGAKEVSGTLSALKIIIKFLRHDFYDENCSLNSHEMEFMWYPTLSVFDSVKHAIPCAGTKHEFTLTPFPDSVYQKGVIESRAADKTHLSSGAGTTDNFKLEILDMRFYVLTCDSNRIEDNFDFLLDLNEIQCQSTPITSTSQQQSLDVIPSTNGLTLAFQDSAALNNSMYPISKFHIRDNLELNLSRYYIRYEGQVPQPDSESSLVRVGDGNDGSSANGNGKKDFLKDVYNRTKLYDGTLFMEQPESLEVYRSRGMYIYHPFPKTASSKNTRVYVQVNFSSLNDSGGVAQSPFMLLFSHYKKAVILNVKNGRIVGVQPINA